MDDFYLSCSHSFKEFLSHIQISSFNQENSFIFQSFLSASSESHLGTNPNNIQTELVLNHLIIFFAGRFVFPFFQGDYDMCVINHTHNDIIIKIELTATPNINNSQKNVHISIGFTLLNFEASSVSNIAIEARKKGQQITAIETAEIQKRSN